MPQMTITTLVTQVEPGASTSLDAVMATPFVLAEAYAAGIIALVFPIETERAAAMTPSWDLASAEQQTVEQLRIAAERRGVSCTIRARSSFAYGVSEVFADHLRVADLGVVALHASGGAGQRMLLNGAIFDSGRPILIVGQDQPLRSPPSRVVVAWDATAAAVRATHAALSFIRRAAETFIVTVSDDKDLRPGRSGIEIAHLLARHGAKARFSAVRRDSRAVLEAIGAAAEDMQADLLVMGAMRHSPARNIILGSATQDLLDGGPPLATLVAA
jgi:nucleotide-binding universal stress UspA family protein